MKKLFVLFIFLFFTLSVEAPPETPVVHLPTVVIKAKTYDREIFDTALELGADSLTAKILVAQARFESGGYTNRLTRLHNNVFSMQHARQRATTSLGAFASAEGRPNTYASYSSVRSAVVDLFYYFDARKIDLRQHSITNYVYILKSKSFFEASTEHYKKGLWKEFQKVNV